jgi:hypothetical protein
MWKNPLLSGSQARPAYCERSMESGNSLPVALSMTWMVLSSDPPGEIP